MASYLSGHPGLVRVEAHLFRADVLYTRDARGLLRRRVAAERPLLPLLPQVHVLLHGLHQGARYVLLLMRLLPGLRLEAAAKRHLATPGKVIENLF